ncbi:hypothetical protein Bhyg_03427 [Pseudolycoriella hygida]|uniref:Uncharacterized protein n=1 Tax=Pseudolycoriella hygida TaxID=35572 RepID=A0A9Q0S9D1_9DIPT|nr:hypothetical protein Bhyg_03427 [Pseudolycoriella hygida]
MKFRVAVGVLCAAIAVTNGAVVHSRHMYKREVVSTENAGFNFNPTPTYATKIFDHEPRTNIDSSATKSTESKEFSVYPTPDDETHTIFNHKGRTTTRAPGNRTSEEIENPLLNCSR